MGLEVAVFEEELMLDCEVGWKTKELVNGKDGMS
jgi:hypothetical protein